VSRTGTLRAAVLLLAAAAVAPGCGSSSTGFRGLPYPDPAPPADFALSDQHGAPFRLSDHRGKIVLLFFGFVHCPDVCPTTLATWSKVREQLGQDASRVAFVFVTVDPERDTGAALREHLAVFGADFVGLTGTLEELDPVYESFGIFHEKMRFGASANAYIVDHSTRVLLIDAQGRLRLSYGFETSSGNLLHDLRLLLEE
jgi:protein SCO1/2